MASAQNRCGALAINGDVTGADFISQSNDALARLRAAGWEVESDLLHASHWGLQATPAVAVTYANAYSRASVIDNLCGFSFRDDERLARVCRLATAFTNADGIRARQRRSADQRH